MNIQLQTEKGVVIGQPIMDERNVLPRLLADANADRFVQLGHLDLYGDTTFNNSQLDVVAAEWKLLAPHAQTPDERGFIASVDELIDRARSEPHSYLKFIGD